MDESVLSAGHLRLCIFLADASDKVERPPFGGIGMEGLETANPSLFNRDRGLSFLKSI